MTGLKPGDIAPDFVLETDTGISFRLSAQRGRPVVLFFYPEDDSQGCTIENTEFSRLAGEFAALSVAVLGVSPDTIDKHCAFRDRHGLKVRLAADPDRAVIGAYGLWGPKKLYGREYDGLHRTTLLIDRDGRIAAIWPVRRIRGHAKVVLDRARELATPF